MTPLLVGRGFLATASAVIDCRKAKIAVGEGITRSIFGVKEINLGIEQALVYTTLIKNRCDRGGVLDFNGVSSGISVPRSSHLAGESFGREGRKLFRLDHVDLRALVSSKTPHRERARVFAWWIPILILSAFKPVNLRKKSSLIFLENYPIPPEYKVMVPKRNQTIFDAPNGGFFNLFPGDSIIPAGCPRLLSKDNRWDTKSFGDKLPDKIHENPFFQCLGRYPTSVRVFPDPILFMVGLKSSWEHGQQRPAIIVGRQEMAFKNFIYAETDEDISFLPKKPSLDFGTGSSSVLINTDPLSPQWSPRDNCVDGRIKERKFKTRGGSSRPPVKRKLVQGGSSSKSTRQNTSPPTGSYFLTSSEDDEGLPDVLELQNANGK
ncbi:hypothetical protein Tco_1219256 [Tanacetum coccineum]